MFYIRKNTLKGSMRGQEIGEPKVPKCSTSISASTECENGLHAHSTECENGLHAYSTECGNGLHAHSTECGNGLHAQFALVHTSICVRYQYNILTVNIFNQNTKVAIRSDFSQSLYR